MLLKTKCFKFLTVHNEFSTFWPHRRNKNMVKFYVTQIRLHRFDGSFTIKNVPARLQAAVKEMLEEQQNA